MQPVEQRVVGDSVDELTSCAFPKKKSINNIAIAYS